jgi:pimeloyl-ACP methyl ester carboxylesterase
LAFEELGSLPGAVRETHLGIAGRAFAGVGPPGRPVRLVHDAVSRSAYAAVGAGVRLLGRATDGLIARERLGEQLELSAAPAGSAAIGALNGLIGDRLERTGSELHQQASVRVAGRAVALEPDALRAAFPTASDHVVVFVHGLMGTELHWQLGASGAGGSYGARLESDLGCTPVYIRYNSGRHISQNGRSIAALLEELAGAWPVRLRQLDLVGHSMGGLVARSAAHHASQAGHDWPALTDHLVTLGTPHLGAPLEQAVHVAAAAFASLPETRMLAAFLRRRSAGIRDLRHGSLVDEDWQGRDPEELRAAACAEVPLLAGATHCFVAATITRDARHPLGRLLGDVLVLVPSATGRGRARRMPLRDANSHHVGRTHHLALLNHAEVYGRLRAWLDGRAERRSSSPTQALERRPQQLASRPACGGTRRAR